MLTAAEKLAARVARIATPQLVSLHGLTLAQMYAAADKAPLAKKGTASEPYHIVVAAIATELVRRDAEMTACCFSPAGHHDERICDRNGPTPLSRAADVITDAVMVCRPVRDA